MLCSAKIPLVSPRAPVPLAQGVKDVTQSGC